MQVPVNSFGTPGNAGHDIFYGSTKFKFCAEELNAN